MRKSSYTEETPQHDSGQAKEWMSISEVARAFSLGRQTVRTILPQIPGASRISPRTVRIPRWGVEAYLAARRTA